LSSRCAVLLGSASYSLYLLELPIREWMRVLFTGPWELFGRSAYPLVLILLSIVVFKAFEEPARSLLNGLGRTASPPGARSPSPMPAAGSPIGHIDRAHWAATSTEAEDLGPELEIGASDARASSLEMPLRRSLSAFGRGVHLLLFLRDRRRKGAYADHRARRPR